MLMKKAISILAVAALAAVLAVLLAGCDGNTGEPHRATDGPGRWARVLTDAETGCQYLTPTGGSSSPITPRLDAYGRPMGCHSPQTRRPDIPETPGPHW